MPSVEDALVRVERSIVIERPIADVFGFVADARNDTLWCSKVLSSLQTDGDGPGPGARYEVLHRPIPLRPAREMDHRCLDWAPPRSITWSEDDGRDTLVVTYQLEELGGSTRMIQMSDARLAAPRVLHPLMRAGIGHDIQRQLGALKVLLEAGSTPARPAPAEVRPIGSRP